MKGMIRNIAWFVLLGVLSACQEETFSNKDVMEENTLTLTLATQAESRVPENGEDRFHENTIERADVYFFNVNTAAQDAQPCIYAQMGLSADASNVVRVPLDRNVLTENTYYVYAVANHDFGYTPATAVSNGVTIAQLKQQAITTNWKEGYAEGESTIETSLVMDGEKSITIQTPQTAAEEIKMTRAMAKVMLYASTASEIEVDGTTYKPIQNGMNVTMVYGVNKTNLAGNYEVKPDDYITRMRRDYSDNTTSGTDGTVLYEQESPFFSYPNPADTENRQDAYLILCVPWQITDTSGGSSYEAQDYYYRIPITGDNDPALLERNHYYRIVANIGVLGSLNPRDAVELTANFEIMDWFEVGIDADMQNYRYLVLDEYNSVMNNVDVLEMPYVSSSAIAWSDHPDPTGRYTHIVSVSYWDYHLDESYEVTLTPNYTYDRNNSNRPVVFSDFILEPGSEGTLRIRHPLNNDDDFVPYTITVEVYNTQGLDTELWTITQYPAMYIIGENNEDNGNRNRFVNGYNSGTPRDDDWNNLGTLVSIHDYDAGNRNPNLYTIHITSFDVGDIYAIGDPRSETYYQFRSELNATQYKATREDAENIISPIYKIASSWGQTSTISENQALKRCASYQEAGYPAGRWRIPTKAEVEYIINLSEDGKIPRLFNVNGNYWTSTGVYNTSSGMTERNSAFVRCVYDVWYWGNQTIETDEYNTDNYTNNQFVWGDAENGTLREGTEH